MKFPHLPIGQRFSFKGKTYTKTGPLTASEENTGKNRLIMKSAEVMPLEITERPAETRQKQFSPDEVGALLVTYRLRLRDRIQAAAGSQGSLSLERVLELIDAQELPVEFD